MAWKDNLFDPVLDYELRKQLADPMKASHNCRGASTAIPGYRRTDVHVPGGEHEHTDDFMSICRKAISLRLSLMSMASICTPTG